MKLFFFPMPTFFKTSNSSKTARGISMYLLMTIGHTEFMPEVTPGGPGHSPKRGKFDVFFAIFLLLAFSKTNRRNRIKLSSACPGQYLPPGTTFTLVLCLRGFNIASKMEISHHIWRFLDLFAFSSKTVLGMDDFSSGCFARWKELKGYKFTLRWQLDLKWPKLRYRQVK